MHMRSIRRSQFSGWERCLQQRINHPHIWLTPLRNRVARSASPKLQNSLVVIMQPQPHLSGMASMDTEAKVILAVEHRIFWQRLTSKNRLFFSGDFNPGKRSAIIASKRGTSSATKRGRFESRSAWIKMRDSCSVVSKFVAEFGVLPSECASKLMSSALKAIKRANRAIADMKHLKALQSSATTNNKAHNMSACMWVWGAAAVSHRLLQSRCHLKDSLPLLGHHAHLAGHNEHWLQGPHSKIVVMHLAQLRARQLVELHDFAREQLGRVEAHRKQQNLRNQRVVGNHHGHLERCSVLWNNPFGNVSDSRHFYVQIWRGISNCRAVPPCLHSLDSL